MFFCKKDTHNAQFFSSVSYITDEIWQQLNAKSLYFSPKYLKAIEQNNKQLHFSYIVLFDNLGNPVALAILKTVDFYLKNVQNTTQGFVKKAKCLGEKLGVIPKEKPFKILTCGNTFVSGEHGIFIKKEQNKSVIFKQLTTAISYMINANIVQQEIGGIMIKDFVNETLPSTNQWEKQGYNPFSVEPNMVMDINENWNNFEDYLTDLKTKFRVKAKKAMQLSKGLLQKEITLQNINEYLPKMELLYTQVSANSGFNLVNFNLQSYKTLKENLDDNYVIKAYFLENKLVGFLSAIINLNELDAHFVGIDYHLNRKHAIYQRILYDYIQLAINKKAKRINFGRTASEIKTSVGAVPQNLTIYFKHKQHIPNKIVSLFIHKIQPTEFRQNFPFKETKSVVKL